MSNISNNTNYIYSNGRIVAVRNNGQEMTFQEKRMLEAFGTNDDASSSGGLSGDWISLQGGLIDGYAEYQTVEDLTVEQIVALFNGLDTDYAGLPASELQKWAEAHGVNDLIIKDTNQDNQTVQHVTFTDPETGKTYDMTNVSFEVGNSYEYMTGKQYKVMDSESVDDTNSALQKPIDVSTPEELQKALKENPNAIIYINADLDMSGIDWETIDKFSGAIYGGDHVIKNLNIKGNGETVGFIGELAGLIRDLRFDNVTVTNDSKDPKSCSGVVAGRMVDGGRLEEVHVTNSSVTGGAMAGMLVGEAIKSYSQNRGCQASSPTDIMNCTVKNSTVAGDYASGGMVGYANGIGIAKIYNPGDNTAPSHYWDDEVENVIINGGQWAGGVVGSADNAFYTKGQGANGQGKRTLYPMIGASANNITINGGYNGNETLGAGGIFGRTSTLDIDDYDEPVTWQMKTGKNVTVNNTYAFGNKIGWICDIDPETGKVLCNGSKASIISNRGDIGRAGITELESVETYGTSFNLQEQLLYIAEFARKNGLKELPNIKGVYEDSNGVLYFLNGTKNSETNEPVIACSDYNNSIEAFKEYCGHMENRGYDSTALSLIGWDVYPEIIYILSQEGATNVVSKRAPEDRKDENGKVYGEEAFEEIYYQTQDGSWHKLTTSLWGNTDVRDPKYEDAEALATKGLYGKDLKDLKYEDYKAAFQGTPDNIQLLTQLVEGGHYVCPEGPHYSIENLTYEQVAEEIGVLAGQPPYNSGFNDEDESDGVVEDLKPDQLYLEGIDLDPNAQLTYETVRDMLILTNFLNYNVFFGKALGGYDDVPNQLTAIGGQLQITEENWQQYKDLIPMYDKEQLVEKVMEKLSAVSWKIIGQQDVGEGPDEWVTSLLKAMGVNNYSFTPAKYEFFQNGSGAVDFGRVSFTLNGTSYTIPIAATNGQLPYDNHICTKEQIEEIAKLVPESELKDILYFWFTPMYTVNGEVQEYMFSWDGNIRWEKGAKNVPGMITPVRGLYSYDDLLEYIQTHPELYGRVETSPKARVQESGDNVPTSQSDEKDDINTGEDTETKAAEEARIKAEQEKANRTADAGTVINSYISQLAAYAGYDKQFTDKVNDIRERYIAGEISKTEFDSQVKSVFDNLLETAKNKAQEDDAKNDDNKPPVLITFDDYEAEAAEQAKKQGLIRDEKTGLYSKYDPTTHQTYNWLWNPETKKFDVFTNAELNTNNPDDRIIRLRQRRQAIIQRLSFTSDSTVCVDKDGNYYDYNEVTGKFEIRK